MAYLKPEIANLKSTPNLKPEILNPESALNPESILNPEPDIRNLKSEI